MRIWSGGRDLLRIVYEHYDTDAAAGALVDTRDIMAVQMVGTAEALNMGENLGMDAKVRCGLREGWVRAEVLRG